MEPETRNYTRKLLRHLLHQMPILLGDAVDREADDAGVNGGADDAGGDGGDARILEVAVGVEEAKPGGGFGGAAHHGVTTAGMVERTGN